MVRHTYLYEMFYTNGIIAVPADTSATLLDPEDLTYDTSFSYPLLIPETMDSIEDDLFAGFDFTTLLGTMVSDISASMHW